MADVAASDRARREVNMNLRVSRGQKALIDRAAAALGRNRTEFMLEAACREAEAVLLDWRYFALDHERFQAFLAALDAPPSADARLRRLMAARAPWER